MAVPTVYVRVDWANDGAFTGGYDDITSRVRSEGLTWTRGRSSDFSGEATGQAQFVLRNDDDRFTPDRQWHDNPSFEAGTTGWSTTAITSLTAAATSISQVTDNATSATGTKAGEAVLTGTQYSGVTYAIPYLFRSGVTYAFSVYLKSSSGNLNVRAGLASSGTPADIGSTSSNITTSWVAYSGTWTPSADRADAVFFVRTTTAASATLRIDGIQVNPGSSANTYIEAPSRGQLVPGRPVHIYANYSSTDYPQFFGYIERITPQVTSKTVTITCYDVLRRLAETDIVVPSNAVVQRCPRDYRVEVLSDFERGTINLCHNGSFETDTTGWTMISGTSLSRNAADAAPGLGSACLEFVAASQYNRAECKLRLAPTFFADQVYRVSFWAKMTSGGTLSVGTYIGTWSALDKYVTIPTTETSWTRHTFTVKLASTATASSNPLTFAILANAAGTIRIDGVMVSRGTDDPLYTESVTGRWPNFCGNGGFDGQDTSGWHDAWQNLCGNPSFESDTSGWSVAGDAFVSAATSITRSTSQAKYGTASGLVDVNAGGQGTFYAITGTFTSGVTYDVTLSAYAVTGSPVLTLGIGSQGTPTDKSETTQSLSSSAWSTKSLTWVPSSNRTDVHVYAKTAVTLGDFYLDGVTVTRRSPTATTGPAYSNVGPGAGGVPPTSSGTSTTVAKWGASSLSVVAPATATVGKVYDFNHFGSYFLSGRSYTASVWLYCSGSLPYKVGIGRNKADGTWDEASATGTASAATWTQVTVTWTPTADGDSTTPFNVVLYVLQTDATSRTFYIDGVRVIPGNAADDFELSQWDLCKGRECSTASQTTSISSSALAALTTINEAALTRHFIAPTMASPWYKYTTKEWPGFASVASSETYTDDMADFASADIDRNSIVNLAAVTYFGSSVEYYPDQTSIAGYGKRPATLNGFGMGGTESSAKAVADVVGPSFVARYKDPRARPTMTVANRFPSQLTRQLDEVITVNLARLRLSGAKYVIVSLTTTVSKGGASWVTAYLLEEYPY